MTVLCAIPIQIPVHRIRVTAKCLATGGPVHTAVLRLADYWGDSPEEIAEVLGLPIHHVEYLLEQLQEGGEPIEREFVLWVDHARERVLPYSALSGVAVRPSRHGPFTLPVDPPTPARLRDMGLDAGMSWDLGLEGHVEVLDVLDVLADIRDKNLPHVLRLPDTQLVISTAEHGPATPTTPSPSPPTTPTPATSTPATGAPEHITPAPARPAFKFQLAQHGAIDPRLTAWARNNYAEELANLTNGAELDATDSQLKDLAKLTEQGSWQTLQPHPATLREHTAEAAQNATERLVLSAPDLRIIPTWLQEIITETSERDVQIVLAPTQDDLIPTRATFEFTTSPAPNHQPQALSILADERHALTHTDPAAFLERRGKPQRQYAYTTQHTDAIAGLLDRLGLKRLRAPAPRYKPDARRIATMLRQALGELQAELPNTITATIQPEDDRFALETIDRQRNPENPTNAARKTAAGIAWERTLTILAHHLAGEHDQLHVIAERWRPKDVRLDLDLILADDRKQTVWIIDAKNAHPTNDQLHKMQNQIKLLQKEPKLTDGRRITGVIVHRKHQLDPQIQPTEHHNILRATIQRLPDLLLAKQLPGERPQLVRLAPG
jgi:hypothetical protein